jgi:tight adherence protein B
VTASYSPKPLADLFHRCAEQIEMGRPAAEAVGQAAQETRLVELEALATAFRIHREVGGSLAALLDRLAASVRDRNQLEGHFRAATALGRITAFFLAAAPIVIVLLLYFWEPEYLLMITKSPLGWGLLIAAAVLEVIGILWVYWLLRRLER